MRRRLAVIALMATTAGLASCDRFGTKAEPSGSSPPGSEDPGAASTKIDTAADAQGSTFAPSEPADHNPPAPAQMGMAIEGAPVFAVLYPGATVDTTPLAVSTEGGGVVFTSDASPEAIIEFYRDQAQAAGMVQIMAMNNGDSRAFGASKATGGTSLTIVARPLETGETTAQLTWTPGQ